MKSDETPSEGHAEAEAEYHVPGHFWPKMIFLLSSFVFLAFGFSLLWPPLSRVVFGETSEARVVYIEKREPGKEDVTYRYRRSYEREAELNDYSLTFRHYVAVEAENEREKVLRLAIDTRVQPLPEANVNDTVVVSYFPDGDIAYAKFYTRTWAFGVAYCAFGVLLLGIGVPMVWAVGKPIKIDP